MDYYAKAAAQGHVKSQLNLGLLYYRGDVVEQDLEAALKWLTTAAKQDSSEAQGYLGNMYTQGAGVTQNQLKGLMWLILAVENTDKRFVNRHTKMLNYTSSQMSAEQIAQAKQLAQLCKTSGFTQCDA